MQTPLSDNKYRMGHGLSNRLFVLALLLPSIIIMGSVIFYPVIKAVLISLTNEFLLSPTTTQYVGLQNYSKLTADPNFWLALINTLYFAVFTVAGAFLLGFALALLLNQKIRFRAFFRGLAVIPWIVPSVAAGYLFLFMFNSQVGIINYVLQKLGIIHTFLDWFGNPNLALPAMIIANIWNNFPFFMLMLLAALQSVPDDQMEAAKIDGANLWQRFWHVTIPTLQQTILITTTLMFIWSFNNFTLIWVTTQGGPINATTTLAVYVYQNAFRFFQFGYAATIGIVWLLILLVFSVFYIRVMERESA